MHREQNYRAFLAEPGIPPENGAVGLNATKEALLKVMPKLETEAMTQRQLFEKSGVLPELSIGKIALKALVLGKQVERIGKGIKRDPYRYYAEMRTHKDLHSLIASTR